MTVLVVDIVLGAGGFVVLTLLAVLLWRRVSGLRADVRVASERVAGATAGLDAANARRPRALEHGRGR